MTISKAEETLLVTLLKEPCDDETKWLATKIAELRPEGNFSTRIDPETGAQKLKELVFKYSIVLRNGKELNITFAPHAAKVGKPKANGVYSDFEMQFIILRAGFTGEQSFTQASTNGVRISTGKLKYFYRYDVDEKPELDVEYYLRQFENSLTTEVSVCTSKFKRKKSTADTKAIKQVNSENKLKQELFTTHNLVGNERREKLFAYLLKHCDRNLRLVEQMFGEMVHIIT